MLAAEKIYFCPIPLEDYPIVLSKEIPRFPVQENRALRGCHKPNPAAKAYNRAQLIETTKGRCPAHLMERDKVSSRG